LGKKTLKNQENLKRWIRLALDCKVQSRQDAAIRTSTKLLQWVELLTLLLDYHEEIRDERVYSRLITPFGIEATYGALRPVSLGGWLDGVFKTKELVVSYENDRYYVLQFALHSARTYSAVMWSTNLQRVVVRNSSNLPIPETTLERIALKLREMNELTDLDAERTYEWTFRGLQEILDLYDTIGFDDFKRENPSLRKISRWS
jgi:hypothetical protein